MRIRPVGVHALLIDCAGADQVEAWRAELWRRRERGELTAVEIVPAATTVLLDGVPDLAATAARIAAWQPRPDAHVAPGVTAAGSATAAGGGTPAAAGPVEVPVTYDGEDLPLVADHWGVDVPAVVDRLGRTRFRVAFCGFAPGFAYLTGLPAELAVPRLPSPRPRVPAGSVALAGPYAGIYPAASPGGWLLVGRTGMPLFDVRADPPARLTPGTRVRLVAA
ncbi:5-oxoprolinase subunit B family protein [Micromonospora sp. URMC 107]|uniref:5-oxoprolinase subunit B family protein n=1 Tax=Micromonospora sp. URMC 107 TaxID=3423418 RepID=UPI003F1A7C02